MKTTDGEFNLNIFPLVLIYLFFYLLQIQFLIVFIHTIQIQFQPNCQYNKSIGALLTLNAALFTYMFSSFYIKSYNKTNNNNLKKKVQEKLEDSMNELIDENGNDIKPKIE